MNLGPLTLDDMAALPMDDRRRVTRLRYGIQLGADVLNVSQPGDAHVRNAPGQRRAALVVPVPVWLVVAIMNLREWLPC